MPGEGGYRAPLGLGGYPYAAHRLFRRYVASRQLDLPTIVGGGYGQLEREKGVKAGAAFLGGPPRLRGGGAKKAEAPDWTRFEATHPSGCWGRWVFNTCPGCRPARTGVGFPVFPDLARLTGKPVRRGRQRAATSMADDAPWRSFLFLRACPPYRAEGALASRAHQREGTRRAGTYRVATQPLGPDF